jgi:hypothetical protein
MCESCSLGNPLRTGQAGASGGLRGGGVGLGLTSMWGSREPASAVGPWGDSHAALFDSPDPSDAPTVADHADLVATVLVEGLRLT